MGYLEVCVLFDGDASEEWVYEDPENPDEIIADLVHELQTDLHAAGVSEKSVVELYKLWHDHDMDQEECICIQYLTDHHPEWTNKKDEE